MRSLELLCKSFGQGKWFGIVVVSAMRRRESLRVVMGREIRGLGETCLGMLSSRGPSCDFVRGNRLGILRMAAHKQEPTDLHVLSGAWVANCDHFLAPIPITTL